MAFCTEVGCMYLYRVKSCVTVQTPTYETVQILMSSDLARPLTLGTLVLYSIHGEQAKQYQHCSHVHNHERERERELHPLARQQV